MDYFKKNFIYTTVVFIGLMCISAFSDDTLQLYEKEIKELQRKIEGIDANIAQVENKIDDDSASFNAYQNHYDSYYAQLQAESDSLQKDYHDLYQQTDSLARSIQKVKNKQHEFDLLQNQLYKIIQLSCKELKKILQHMPPGICNTQLQSLQFLESELSVHAVGNSEALERLWHILLALADGAETIDIFSGPSPVPGITGHVDYIRLGFAYTAFVNEKATAAAVWIPDTSDTSGGSWQRCDNPQHLLALKKCIQIRQGSAVPEIVSIPFAHPIIDDSMLKKGTE